MGYLMKLECNNCGYTKTAHLGTGIRDLKEEVILAHFEGDSRDKAEEVLKNAESGKDWHYDTVLGQCGECRRIMEVPILIKNTGERIFSECECGGKLKLWIHDESSLQQKDELPLCPECGNELTSTHAGLWD